MELIGDLYSEDLINKQTKNEFKGFVKKKVNETALKYLKDLQLGHSKTMDIKCEKLEIQPYIESSLLFNFRSSMIKGIKINFSSKNRGDMKCPL